VTTTGTTSTYQHMFRSFGLKENPFQVSLDPRFLFSGPSYETALAELMFGIEAHRGLLVLTGEAGTGKTTLMRHFLQWLNSRQFSSSYIFHTHLHPADLFELVLRDFGVPVESTRKSDLLATLHRWLHDRQVQGDSPVIVIDEAQALSLRTLGELNLLLNLENARGKLVQIVLTGQPELEEKLRRPELRALRQRIMVRCRLPLLSLEETQDYIASRLLGAGGSGVQTFPPETVQTIYSYARGIPRVVNLLCEQALIGAYADRSKTVSSANVRRVAAEFDLVGESFEIISLDSRFTPEVSAHVSSASGSIPHVEPPAAAEIPATVEFAASEKTMSAAAAAAVAPVAQSAHSTPIEESVPLRPVLDSVVLSEEKTAIEPEPCERESPVAEATFVEPLGEPVPDSVVLADSAVLAKEQTAIEPEPRQQEFPGAKAICAEPVGKPVLDPVVLSEDRTPEQSALKTPELETVVAAMPSEPAPALVAENPVAGNPASDEEQFTLHTVPSRDKGEPAREHKWGKHRAQSKHRIENKHRAESMFAVYWRDVAKSFARDWRAFLASFAPMVGAFAGNVPQRADSLRRKVIAPLRTWLRTPIVTARPRDVNSNAPRPRANKP
jgi:general secretion pathway protein A